MLKKRIPTIVGLILLLVGAFGGVLFVNQKTDFLPRAAPEYAPQKVKITNLSENGFTVSWTSQEPAVGFVKYGDSASNLNMVATDERDQLSGNSSQYRTHYISIQNLKPQTKYFFKLGSQKNQLYDNNGKAFEITTPAVLGTPPPADTAYGTVFTNANTPAEGAIVYVSLEGGIPISGLVRQNGNWAVNLSTARSSDLANYLSYDPESAHLNILVQPSTGEVANAVTTTNNDQPVPMIVLGQSYDFSSQAPPVEPTDPPESQFSFQDVEATEGEIDPTIKITTIPVDGTEVDTVQPEIKGKAPANTSLTITIHSNQAYTDVIDTDTQGNWNWTPPGNLEPGEHTLTVSYTDEEGILHKVTRNFVVSAADAAAGMYDDPSYEATPAATPIPTPVPTPVPTPEPTPKARTTVATTSAVPQAGSTGPTSLILVFGLSLFAAGTYVSKKHW